MHWTSLLMFWALDQLLLAFIYYWQSFVNLFTFFKVVGISRSIGTSLSSDYLMCPPLLPIKVKRSSVCTSFLKSWSRNFCYGGLLLNIDICCVCSIFLLQQLKSKFQWRALKVLRGLFLEVFICSGLDLSHLHRSNSKKKWGKA